MAKPASNSVINQNITDEDIADALKLQETPPSTYSPPTSEEVQEIIKKVYPDQLVEQVGSMRVETNNMYVEDNTGKPLSAPAAEWESTEEEVSVTIGGKTSTMKVTTYTDPVGGWPEEEAR